MIKFNKIIPIKRKPFFIFEIENFLDEDLYLGLKKNFPYTNELHNLKNMQNFKNNKFAFQTNNELYDQQLNNNKFVKRLHEIIK